jgi:hypothetical protein
MRPGWFSPECLPLLECYCVQAAVARFVGEHLQSLSVDDPKFRRLANLHAKAVMTMRLLAVTLRITPQSNKRSIRDGRDPLATGFRKPWEDDEPA